MTWGLDFDTPYINFLLFGASEALVDRFAWVFHRLCCPGDIFWTHLTLILRLLVHGGLDLDTPYVDLVVFGGLED